MAEKIKLDISSKPHFIQYGLVTSEPVYRLCWLLNTAFSISLTESEPLNCLHAKRNMLQSFMLFEAKNTEHQTSFSLIQNKGPQGFFDEDQKQVDFWLRVDGEIENTFLLSTLKKIKEINLTFELKPGLVKTKSRLNISLDELKNQGLTQV